MIMNGSSVFVAEVHATGGEARWRDAVRQVDHSSLQCAGVLYLPLHSPVQSLAMDNCLEFARFLGLGLLRGPPQCIVIM